MTILEKSQAAQIRDDLETLAICIKSEIIRGLLNQQIKKLNQLVQK